MDGFFRGIVKSKIDSWGVLETLGKNGVRICSDWVTVSGNESLEEAFTHLNPGFYDSNSKIQYQFSSITPQWTPSK